MSKAKKDVLGERLEKAVNDMLDQVKGEKIDVELKMKAFDRAVKFWAVKSKVADAGLGAGFREEDEQEKD